MSEVQYILWEDQEIVSCVYVRVLEVHAAVDQGPTFPEPGLFSVVDETE